MNHLLYSVIFMIVGSFVIQYYAMSYLMTSSPSDITNSLGKAYISTIMALIMGILEVVMNDWMMKKIHWSYYILLGLLLAIFLMMYRKQVGITDEQYVKEMIEFILHKNEIVKSWPLYFISLSHSFYRFSEYMLYTSFMMHFHRNHFFYYPYVLYGNIYLINLILL